MKPDAAGAYEYIFNVRQVGLGIQRAKAEKVLKERAEIITRQIGIRSSDLHTRKPIP